MSSSMKMMMKPKLILPVSDRVIENTLPISANELSITPLPHEEVDTNVPTDCLQSQTANHEITNNEPTTENWEAGNPNLRRSNRVRKLPAKFRDMNVSEEAHVGATLSKVLVATGIVLLDTKGTS